MVPIASPFLQDYDYLVDLIEAEVVQVVVAVVAVEAAVASVADFAFYSRIFHLDRRQ